MFFIAFYCLDVDNFVPMEKATTHTTRSNTANIILVCGGVGALSGLAFSALQSYPRIDLGRLKKLDAKWISGGGILLGAASFLLPSRKKEHLHGHDAEAWKKKFNTESQKAYSKEPNDLAQMRVDIFEQTKAKRAEYVTDDVLRLAQSKISVYSSVFSSFKSSSHKPNVRVEDQDCLVAALKLQEDHESVAVLNMANSTSPGGGVKGGAGAQEENICRRSDLWQILSPEVNETMIVAMRGKKSGYLVPWEGVIYSPTVHIFRGPESEGYPFMEQAATIAVITSAAERLHEWDNTNEKPIFPNRTKRKEEEQTRKHWEDDMRAKIRVQLAIAVNSGHDALVLSAFGCGAFKNPPKLVAKFYKEEIDRLKNDGTLGSLKTIVFAIFDDHNAIANRVSNVEAFKKVLTPIRYDDDDDDDT